MATGVVITNPLVKYRALVATRAINADPAQHRLAIYLQDLYDRLKDYEPQVEYSQRLDQISRTIAREQAPFTTPKAWRSLLRSGERESLALTRRLTNLESAMQMQSPRGLMLHGEVGTGKSMLIDLFADCLPTRKKRRWHFNNFMLETFAKLEAMRRSRTASLDSNDHSMLRLARDMLETSPILFLDEFQLPDRAASKIMTNLMTSFFHLGGVLVATSNRMPEELAKAAGMEFGPAPQDLGPFRRSRRAASDAMFAGQNEFASFLQVLKARCDIWEIEGSQDYRRLDSGSVVSSKGDEDIVTSSKRDTDNVVASNGDTDGDVHVAVQGLQEAGTPQHYAISEEQTDVAALISQALGTPIQEWSPAVLKVYGRLVPVPRSHDGVSFWTFDELCQSTLGPADYITLASTYHTIVLTDVPLLTWALKNEARRFITLLDALYECRCKLLVSAAAGPDDLFKLDKLPDENDFNAIYSETFAEAYQDSTAPFRPNILTQNPNYAEPDPEPDYTHARLAGLLNAQQGEGRHKHADVLSADALEDEPPNKPHKSGFARSFGRTDAEMERPPIDPDSRPVHRPDFSKTSSFTGEDERFAYKRAQSRLWEMCGARWWARDEPGWHRPVPVEVRRWERAFDLASLNGAEVSPMSDGSDVTIGAAVDDSSRPEESFKIASPFRTATEPPPKFSWTHIWGTMKWGPKAGTWGQGVDALKERDKS